MSQGNGTPSIMVRVHRARNTGHRSNTDCSSQWGHSSSTWADVLSDAGTRKASLNRDDGQSRPAPGTARRQGYVTASCLIMVVTVSSRLRQMTPLAE
jgi:hypothetical protein